MIYVLGVLIALLLLDTGRMRGRLSALPALPDAGVDDEGFTVVTAPGVTIDHATRCAAITYARNEQLDVVDLVPGDLPAIRAMGYAQLVDPALLRKKRLAVGRSAGHAIVVSRDVAERARITSPDDEVAMVKLAVRLKTYAPASFASAVAPREHARPERLARRRAILGAILGASLPVALLIQPALFALLAWGVISHPIEGGIALGIWHLQPALTTAGTKIHARDLLVATIFRAPLELYLFARTLVGGWRAPAPDVDPVDALRPTYEELWTQAPRFFEARRDTCPICSSKELRVHLRVSDLIQHKPGVFTLERCTCGHVFQNPRLSLAGLDYYYKDFYDGLGEEGMEWMFGQGVHAYADRARMVARAAGADPKAWLDVGAGHGHFCCIAKGELPGTRFEGLDLADSIEEAHRRRWIDAAYRGLFPDLAPTLAGKYDAISMSHYLEHTLDPRRELEAAHTALAPKGHLMIEVPDPEFGLGRVLGRWWLPWFQPQHQHFLTTRNLERLLREHGFTPVEWHLTEAHQRVDFSFAAWLVLSRIAPPTDFPWRKTGAARKAWRMFVMTVGTPLLLLAYITDQAAGPLIERGKRGNTYRVLARRD
jgi:SAM-dependent methyltransferase